MIKKTANCLYCGEKMKSKTAKKKFCSDLHRVYYNREKKRGTLGLEIVIKNNKPEIVKYNRNSVLPTPDTDNSQKIAEYEEQLEKNKSLPRTTLTDQRRNFLEREIAKLKKTKFLM